MHYNSRTGGNNLKKIIGIFIMMLLIFCALPIINANDNDYKFDFGKLDKIEILDVPESWLEGADQHQIDDNGQGMVISQTYHIAQEFKPTKANLTVVIKYP